LARLGERFLHCQKSTSVSDHVLSLEWRLFELAIQYLESSIGMPEVVQNNADVDVEFRTAKFVRIAGRCLLAAKHIGLRPDIPPKLDGTLFWFVEEGAALVQSIEK
jgi:hypothetical protein